MDDALAEVTSWVFADMADPREFLSKMNPTGSELHTPGGGDAKSKRETRLAAVGLGATGVATAGGVHAITATVKENKARTAAARKLGGKAAKTGRLARVAHVSPVRAAELAGAGWLGLHGVELTGDVLAARAQVRDINRNRTAKPKPARTVIAARAPGRLVRVEVEKGVGSALRSAADVPGHFRALRDLPMSARGLQHSALQQHLAAQRKAVAKPMPRMPGESAADRDLRQKQHMKQANRAKKIADTREVVEAVAAHPQAQQAYHTAVAGFKQARTPPAKPPLIKNPAVLAGGGAVAGAGALSYSQNRRRGRIAARAPQQVVDELTYTGTISKVDADKRLAFGWASLSKVNGEPYVDRQGDWIPIEVTEAAAYDYVRNSRVGGDMHRRAGITKEFGPHKVADLVESFVVTAEKLAKMGAPADAVPEGWWIGMKVHDDDTWDAIKTGKRTGFSVHGTGLRKDVTL